MNQVQDDEIDLFELFQTLWDGKWKIILTTFVAAIIGVVFSVVKPNSFEVSAPLQNGRTSVFIPYTPINDLLKINQFSLLIDQNSLFKMFIVEFNDYEEMVDVVGTSELVQKSIKDLDVDDKKKALIGFAKAFELKAPSNNEENWTLSFEWHDDLEGMRLFNDAIEQTLLSVKNDAKDSLNELANSIETRNTLTLESLNNDLGTLIENQKRTDNQRLQYLSEQSVIAKELGIEMNKLDSNALSQSPNNSISLSVNSDEIPYYLRGYRAINTEIRLIKNRTDEDRLLTAEGYVETLEKIRTVERDLAPYHLRKTSELIANDNPNDWVEFDLAMADVKSQKKSKRYVALSIVLGGMVGAMYVLISNAVRKRRERLAKA